MSDFPDFPTYFRALWGHDSFPWQARLAEELTERPWPEWITLPTGMGKTATLDIAVYDLARQARLPLNERKAPVRIVFAVNRRIVVDEAFERAKHIAGGLKSALFDKDHPLYPVALALSELSGVEGGVPLETYPLRGATFTDHSWARTPTQPLILTTTLDQLGSRLLFRGYGVSPNARPIHAALLANDALLILDEAHTSKAFSQTLEGISKLRHQAADPLQLPFASVQLTATPPASLSDEPFALNSADHDHSIVHQRFRAPKPAELVPVSGAKGATRHSKLADSMMEKALGLLSGENRRILIVVNRVATAETLLKKLSDPKAKKSHGAEVGLLTGRLRPLDRDTLIKSLNQRHQLKSSSPSPEVETLILIATQCIEVGADFDFDVMLTELAPLDSLRQRFGRLNRQGRDISALAAIFAPEEALDAAKPDPLYGDCLPHVWSWLESNINDSGVVDFGLAAMQAVMPRGAELDALLAPSADAPILLHPHLDLLCQTSPEPHVSPDPALYIHGPGKNFPEVSIVLRADLDDKETSTERLQMAPPLGTEAATLPLHLVRQWLASPNKVVDESGDVPDSFDPRPTRDLEVNEEFMIWRQNDSYTLSGPEDLLPGDILVIPSQIESGSLATLLPIFENDTWKLDQFETAHLLARDRLALRFHPGIVAELKRLIPEGEMQSELQALVGPLFAADEETGEPAPFKETAWKQAIPALAKLLAEHLPSEHPWKDLWDIAAKLSDRSGTKSWRATPYPGKTKGVVFTCRKRAGFTPWPLDPEDLGRQGNSSAEPVSLATHSQAVANRACHNATGLGGILEQTLSDAGLWHDLGKVDPRFQALLQGCPFRAVKADALLAKSGRVRGKREDFLAKQTGLPEGFRHELLSALIVSLSKAGENHRERDLLLHLIASHHGRCRAMAPVVSDSAPEAFDIDVLGEIIHFEGQDCPLAHLFNGVARRFWTLTRRFGWWGLPYLESLLRLADQYESAGHNTSSPS